MLDSILLGLSLLPAPLEAALLLGDLLDMPNDSLLGTSVLPAPLEAALLSDDLLAAPNLLPLKMLPALLPLLSRPPLAAMPDAAEQHAHRQQCIVKFTIHR